MRKREATRCFREALRLNHRHLSSSYYLARIHFEAGKPAHAVTLFRKIVKLDPENWILKQRGKPVNEDWHEIPASYMVHQNFPNPFNGGTTISYDLPAVSRVRLQVFDLLGREVALLTDGTRLAGNHRVPFDAGRLASGIYLYRLTAGGFSETRKMIVLR